MTERAWIALRPQDLDAEPDYPAEAHDLHACDCDTCAREREELDREVGWWAEWRPGENCAEDEETL